jgi:hypothetical protein
MRWVRDHANAARAKGAVLNAYYQLRISGITKQSIVVRIKENLRAGVYIGGFDEYLIQKLCTYSLPNLPSTITYASTDTEFFTNQIRLLVP